MASESTQFVGVRGAELNVRMTLVDHERTSDYMADGERIEGDDGTVISYFQDGQLMISGSCDKTVRLWDLRAGKEMKKSRIVYEQGVRAVGVSRNGRWVVTASGDDGGRWELKAHEVKTGIVKTYEGHSGDIHSIDISADSKLLASGSMGGIVWIWSLETGKLVAGPFESRYDADVIRFSQDSRKLAVKSSSIEVWDIREQKLDIRIEIAGAKSLVVGVPMFWTTGDKTIVAAFNSEDDGEFKTIYEFDASTLETVRTPFKGHTHLINGLALSYDYTLLVSGSLDHTVKLWAFESRQLLASFNLITSNLILAPDARQIAYTQYYSNGPPQIYICDISPDIVANPPPSQEPNNLHISDPLSSGATRLADTRRYPIPTTFATQSLRRPPTVQQEQSFALHHLRKLLPFPFRRNVLPLPLAADPRDPLDCPATLHRLHDYFPLAPVTAVVHSDPNENPRSTHAPITQLSNSASSSTRIRTRLSDWWQIHTDRAAVPVVSVPLAQGKERNATAGAPKPRDDCRPDEDFDSPPSSPTPDSQRASASAQATSGEHGSGRSCFCL